MVRPVVSNWVKSCEYWLQSARRGQISYSHGSESRIRKLIYIVNCYVHVESAVESKSV